MDKTIPCTVITFSSLIISLKKKQREEYNSCIGVGLYSINMLFKLYSLFLPVWVHLTTLCLTTELKIGIVKY